MVLHGRVDEFDQHRGDGVVLTDEGERFYFHCVDIADGTRTIEVGSRVRARRTVGHRGHDEAVTVVRVST